MKKTIALLLTLILFASLCAVPAYATGYTTKSTNSFETDFASGLLKWGFHVLNPIPFYADNIFVTARKESVSFLQWGAPFAHASTLLKMPNGKLICAWYGGSKEGGEDTRIYYSIRTGGLWSYPKKLETGFNTAHWNPVLQLTAQNKVRLYFKSNGHSKNWQGYYCESSDCGRSWSKVYNIALDTDNGVPLSASGPVKNKCLTTSGGLLLAPNSYETDTSRRAVIEYSTDGETWHNSGEIVGYDDDGKEVKIIQPTLWESDDGSVHALMRSAENFMYRADSLDGGVTWSSAYRTSLGNNNSGFDLVETDDGLLWMVCNPSVMTYFRSPLVVYVSADDGNSWEPAIDLVKIVGPEFSYPSIIADGNRLYISYTNARVGICVVTLDYRRLW